MSEQRIDEALRRLAQEYNPPPEPPREAMWEAIRAARAGTAGPRLPLPAGEAPPREDQPLPDRPPLVLRRPDRPGRRAGYALWATGIAAALAVGIGLGRLSVRPGAVAVAPTPAAAPASATAAYRFATTQHLSQAEALLTSFRSGAAGEGPDAQLGAWAGDLLSTTRLMLDSPAADEPRMRVLLEDLELILAQISRLRPGETQTLPGEVEMVREAIERGGMLPKLRTAIPAGSSLAATEEE